MFLKKWKRDFFMLTEKVRNGYYINKHMFDASIIKMKGDFYMKSVLTIQERIKDLRVESDLSLDELSKETGISISALSSYENNEDKDISLNSIIALANFYNVSTDYLLGLTEIKESTISDISELKLDDETIDILKSSNINSRLLCEIIKSENFAKFMSDMEIYVDGLAEMQIRNLNSFVSTMRTKILQRNEVHDSEYYIKTLKACEINETDYFSRLISEDIVQIAKGIKESHRRDKETGDANNPLTDVINIVNEYKNTSDPMKATLTTLSKQLGMNFNKMDASEVLFFKTIVEKYSTVYRSMLPKKGRGKK